MIKRNSPSNVNSPEKVSEEKTSFADSKNLPKYLSPPVLYDKYKRGDAGPLEVMKVDDAEGSS